MLFEFDIEDAEGRLAEAIATIDAGYGVLVRRGGAVIARLVPEAAFVALTAAAAPAPEGMMPEELEMREVFELLADEMGGDF